ncbi:hypothetical protein M885DRAFT_504954 [Pelagophyceae sp. CCMP2097]|nr:hypothetical protein M885DRAFT_504954 [Pelagophyceae sp. CCMP2097]
MCAPHPAPAPCAGGEPGTPPRGARGGADGDAALSCAPGAGRASGGAATPEFSHLRNLRHWLVRLNTESVEQLELPAAIDAAGALRAAPHARTSLGDTGELDVHVFVDTELGAFVTTSSARRGGSAVLINDAPMAPQHAACIRHGDVVQVAHLRLRYLITHEAESSVTRRTTRRATYEPPPLELAAKSSCVCWPAARTASTADSWRQQESAAARDEHVETTLRLARAQARLNSADGERLSSLERSDEVARRQAGAARARAIYAAADRPRPCVLS